MRKNVAGQTVGAGLVTASTLAAFGGTVTCYVTGDGGTQALGTVGSGVCTNEGNGAYTYAPSAAECNYDHILFTFIGTLAMPVTVNVWTDDLFLMGIADFGTLQSVGSGTAVIRAAAANGDNTLRGNIIGILGSTQGYPQYSVINGNTGSTDTITFDAMAVTPSGTLSYAIFGSPQGSATLLPAVNATQFAGQTITAAAGVTLPASVASPTNITAGTITTATNVTTVNGLAANVITAAATATDFTTEIQAGLATAANLATVAGYIDTEVASILAAVDTEVAAILALLDDARGEPAQGTPPVNPDLATKIDYLYKSFRNRVTQTATTYSIYGDDATTVHHKATVADDGVTFSRTEIVTGP